MSNFYNYVPMNSKCRVNSLRGQEEYSTIVVFSSNPATFWMPVPTNTLNIFWQFWAVVWVSNLFQNSNLHSCYELWLQILRGSFKSEILVKIYIWWKLNSFTLACNQKKWILTFMARAMFAYFVAGNQLQSLEEDVPTIP